MSNLLEDVQYCVQAFLLICTSVFPNIPASCTFFLQIFLCSFTLIPNFALILYIVFPHFSNLLFVFPELCALCFQTSFDLCIVFPIFLSVVSFSLSKWSFTSLHCSQHLLQICTTLFPHFSNLYMLFSNISWDYTCCRKFPHIVVFKMSPEHGAFCFLDLCLFFSQLTLFICTFCF